VNDGDSEAVCSRQPGPGADNFLEFQQLASVCARENAEYPAKSRSGRRQGSWV